MNQGAKAFFENYEKANSNSDISAIVSHYADVFLFGGPQGVRAIKNDDLRGVIPRRKDYFSSLGLSDSKLTSLDEINLDSRYVLVKTSWRMTFRKPGGAKRDIEILATYILERKGDALIIVFQIDHQDMTARVKELGLA